MRVFLFSSRSEENLRCRGIFSGAEDERLRGSRVDLFWGASVVVGISGAGARAVRQPFTDDK